MKKFFKTLDIEDYLFIACLLIMAAAAIYLGESINWEFIY